MSPYLLRGLTINRANQVWVLDTTYIPMAKGFVYLTAVVDWVSCMVFASTVTFTVEICHAVDHGIHGLVQPIQTAFEPGYANTS